MIQTMHKLIKHVLTFFFSLCNQTRLPFLFLTEITPESIAVHNAKEVARFVVSCKFHAHSFSSL